jgi:membrane-bound metal-dependent hydrolase YbcI (DUF457 family)
MWFWSPADFAKNGNMLAQLPMSITIISSLIGVWSHVFLDSIMHQDMMPFSPFSDANPFLGFVSLTQLHWGCIFSGVLGTILWALRLRLKQKSAFTVTGNGAP